MELNPYESPLELNEQATPSPPSRPVWLDMFYLVLTAFLIVVLPIAALAIFITVFGPILGLVPIT